METKSLEKIVKKEKRGYLFATICSAVAALLLFYKLLLNNLYLKILEYPMIAGVLLLLIIGNTVHGFFAFRGHQLLDEESSLFDVIRIKVSFYKSLSINFLLPYSLLIILFIYMGEYGVATIASLLFFMMIFGCYFFDLRPTLELKKQAELK